MQIVEAMEIMLLAVVSPEIRCEWRLEDWQVALVSTVSNTAQFFLALLAMLALSWWPSWCIDGLPWLHGVRSAGWIPG